MAKEEDVTHCIINYEKKERCWLCGRYADPDSMAESLVSSWEKIPVPGAGICGQCGPVSLTRESHSNSVIVTSDNGRHTNTLSFWDFRCPA